MHRPLYYIDLSADYGACGLTSADYWAWTEYESFVESFIRPFCLEKRRFKNYKNIKIKMENQNVFSAVGFSN